MLKVGLEIEVAVGVILIAPVSAQPVPSVAVTVMIVAFVGIV